MPASTNITSSQGIALGTLLRNANPTALRQIIGKSTIQILEVLQPNQLIDQNLGNFAAELVEPSEALSDPVMRNQILELLPLPKAHELAKILDIANGKNLYADLVEKAADSSAIPKLFSFFGVVQNELTVRTTSNVSKVEAKYSLFEHQRNAVAKVRYVLSKDPRRVVLHMPTGSGKTRTAMHILCDYLNHNQNTLVCWLAHNSELLEQAACEFEEAWRCLGNRSVDVVRFWAHRNPNLLEARDGIIVAGLSKMHAFDKRSPAEMLRFADRTSLIVIDEAHQAIAPTYRSIITSLKTKRPKNQLLGLTATPGRTWSEIEEDKRLSDFFEGQKIMLEIDGYSDPVDFLINEGYLARPIFKTLNSEAGLTMSASDRRQLAEAVDVPKSLLERLGLDTQRNLKIISKVEDLIQRHQRVIVFAPSVENARIIAQILSVRGLDAHTVTGETNPSKRQRIVQRFRSNINRSMVVVNFGVLTTGFDAPGISAAVIARPTRSLVLYSQMVGRATRGPQAGGNETAEIVTVVDPNLPGFGSITDAFKNWEDVWSEAK